MTRLASEVLGQGSRSFRKHRVLTPHSLNPTLRSHTHGLCALPRPLPWCLKWVLISTVPGHLWSSVSRYRTMIFFSCQGDRWFQSPGPCLPRVCATHSHLGFLLRPALLQAMLSLLARQKAASPTSIRFIPKCTLMSPPWVEWAESNAMEAETWGSMLGFSSGLNSLSAGD